MKGATFGFALNSFNTWNWTTAWRTSLQQLRGFAHACGGGHDLPLCDLIDGIDVVDAFGPRLIALMHGVDARIARLALRIGPPPFSDGRCRGLGLDVVETAFAIAWLLAQVVQVRHRDRGQPLVLPLAVLPILVL